MCLSVLEEVHLPALSGDMVVRRKGLTAVGLDGWGWRERKAFAVSWCEGLADVLRLAEEDGQWPEGLLDAKISVIPIKWMVMVPRRWGRGPCVFFVWYKGCALRCGWGTLKVGAVRWRLGKLLRLILKRSSRA